jgi:hypothetical protein
VHIADNIRKPSEVLRKFLAGSNDSFLCVAFNISKLRKIIISNFDDKLSGSCVRGGFSGFRGGFSLILN